MDVIINISGKCNFTCHYCYYRQDNYFNSFEDSQLSLNTLKEFFGDHLEQIESVALTGGEPLLHRDLEDILHFFREKKILILSNGSLIDDGFVTLFKKYSAGLYISMDKLSGEESLPGERNHKQVRQSVEKLLASGFKDITIGVTLQRGQIHEACEVLEYCHEKELRPSIGIVDYQDNEETMDQEFMEQVREAFKLGYRDRSLFYEYLVEHLFRQEERDIQSCFHAGKGYYVDFDGKVYNCFHSRELIGSVFTDSFSTVQKAFNELLEKRSGYSCFRPACISLF